MYYYENLMMVSQTDYVIIAWMSDNVVTTMKLEDSIKNRLCSFWLNVFTDANTVITTN